MAPRIRLGELLVRGRRIADVQQLCADYVERHAERHKREGSVRDDKAMIEKNIKPKLGSVRVTASPFHWDGRPVHPAGPAPYRVGEHSRLVLSEVLGYDRERIEALIRCGAVEAP